MCHLWAPQLHGCVSHWLAKSLTTGLSEHRQVAVKACWVSTNPFVTGRHVACIPHVYRPLPKECLFSPDLRLLQVLQTSVVLLCLLRYKLHPVAAIQDGRFRLLPGSQYPYAPSLPSWYCSGIDSFCGGHRFEAWFQIAWRSIFCYFEFFIAFAVPLFLKPYSWLKHLFAKHLEISIKGIYH